MREDEFTSYAASRWPTFVRCLVAMGLPVAGAEDAGRRALTDLRVAWRERDGWPDVDVVAYASLAAALRSDPGGWWDEPHPDVPGLDELAPRLDVLDVTQRWRLVLDGVAGLAPEQVDAVVGGASAPTAGAPALAGVALGLPVGPYPGDAVVGGARRRRRRQLLAVTATVVVLLAAGGGGVLAAVTGGGPAAQPDAVATSSSPESSLLSTPPGPGRTVRAGRGTAPVAWYAAGTVHLPARAVRVPAAAALTAAGTQAVITTTGGDVVLVDADGSARRIGRTVTGEPGEPVAADSGSGLVAWVDHATGRLVAVDTAGRREVVSERPVGTAHVIAVDAGRVYWSDDAGDHQSTGRVTTDLRGAPLLDVAGSLVVVQADPRHWEAQAVGYPDGVRALGVGAAISDDGRYVLSRDREDAPVVVDLPRDLTVELPLPERSLPVDAVLGPHDTVTLLLRRATFDETLYGDFRPPPRAATYDLVTCSIPSRRCLLDARIARQTTPPLLAH